MSSFSHFFSKNINVYAMFNDQNFNNTLTNDIVSFEQLGPDLSDETARNIHAGLCLCSKQTVTRMSSARILLSALRVKALSLHHIIYSSTKRGVFRHRNNPKYWDTLTPSHLCPEIWKRSLIYYLLMYLK